MTSLKRETPIGGILKFTNRFCLWDSQGLGVIVIRIKPWETEKLLGSTPSLDIRFQGNQKTAYGWHEICPVWCSFAEPYLDARPPAHKARSVLECATVWSRL
ncbi:hypothetical protein WJX79_003010 [Trebouxia sp. C0005]